MRLFLMCLAFPLAALSQERQAPIQNTTSLYGKECPDDVQWYGNYQNEMYGFSIAIPQGLVAYWNSAGCGYDDELGFCVCMGDHGRLIALADGAAIEVFAMYEDEPLDEPKQLVEKEIGYLKDHKNIKEIKAVFAKAVIDNGMPSIHYRLHYIYKGESYMQEDLLMSDRYEGIRYLIELRSPEKDYEMNLCEWQAVRSSFHLTVIDNCDYDEMP